MWWTRTAPDVWASATAQTDPLNAPPSGPRSNPRPRPATVRVRAGGEDGRTLIVCAASGFDEAAREAHLLTTTVEVPRAGLP